MVFLVWLVVSAILLFAAANLCSRTTLRVLTVLLLGVGVLTLAGLGESLSGASGKPFLEVVLLGAQETGRQVTGALSLDRVRLDAAAGLALLLVLVFAYRKAEITSARRFPGPVEVRPFQQPAASPAEGMDAEMTLPDPAAMEARMRQRLADANVLPPPSVPGGSRQEQLVEVMQKSPLVDIGGVGKLFAFVARAAFPGVGYDVTGTLISETATGGRGVTVSLNDSVSAATVAVRTFVSRTYEEAIDSAAFFVAQDLLRRCTTVPEWQQWWDCRGLEAYQRGRDAVSQRDWERAEQAFSEAGVLSPNNVHPPLELAAVYDLKDRCYETFFAYFSVLKRFPRLIEARYRLTNTYSQVASSDPGLLGERWQDLAALVAEDLRYRPSSKGGEATVDPLAGDDSQEARQGRLYEVARGELEAIKRDLRLPSFLLWRIRSSHRFLVGRNPLLLSSPKVIGGPRRAMLATTATARHALDLKSYQLTGRLPAPAGEDGPTGERWKEELADKVERVLKRRRAGWQAHFNGACFYSMLMSPPPPEGEPVEAWARENDRLARQGMEHLNRAFLDPGSEFNRRPTWILSGGGDHDLDSLRRHPRFVSWKAEMRFDGASPLSPDQLERNELTQAWSGLTKLATALSENTVWVGLHQDLQSSTEIKAAVRKWCLSEHELWARLATWARRPRHEDRWDDFKTTALGTHEALCRVALTTERPTALDWHDPQVTAAQHRTFWSSLADTSATIAQVWKERAERVARLRDEQKIRKDLDDWIEEAWALWECLARCSRAPLRRSLHDELTLKAQTMAAPPNASRPARPARAAARRGDRTSATPAPPAAEGDQKRRRPTAPRH